MIHNAKVPIQGSLLSDMVVRCNVVSSFYFIHNGLVPELNCFEICYPTWKHFVTQSLKKFIETGTGIPYLS